jgi:hypothetical protein
MAGAKQALQRGIAGPGARSDGAVGIVARRTSRAKRCPLRFDGAKEIIGHGIDESLARVKHPGTATMRGRKRGVVHRGVNHGLAPPLLRRANLRALPCTRGITIAAAVPETVAVALISSSSPTTTTTTTTTTSIIIIIVIIIIIRSEISRRLPVHK